MFSNLLLLRSLKKLTLRLYMKNLEFFLWSKLDFKVIWGGGGQWVFWGPSKRPGSISNTCVWDDASKIDQTSVHNKMDCLFPHLTVLSLSSVKEICSIWDLPRKNHIKTCHVWLIHFEIFIISPTHILHFLDIKTIEI